MLTGQTQGLGTIGHTLYRIFYSSRFGRFGRKNVKSAVNKPRHVTRGNVLDDLGFSPEQSTALKFKAELYQAILKYSEKYSQKELQGILG